MRGILLANALLLPISLVAGTARAQAPTANLAPAEAVTAALPDHVDVYFGYGSAQISPEEQATLDRIAALYRKARPRLMIVAGSTDATGNPADNLTLSLRRAQSVLQALVERGLPQGLFEVEANGQNNPPAPGQGAQPRDRVTVVTWKLAANG